MSIYSKLLISTVLLLGCFSEVEAADELSFDSSGFIYSTIFSDADWQESRVKAAVNGDVEYKDFRISTQVTTDKDPLKRLFAQQSFPVTSRDSLFITVGRFPRLDGFYNNATDNPGTSGLAILPLAGYNYKFQTGTFTITDGVEVRTISKVFDTHLATLKLGKGKMYIDNEDQMKKYLLNGNYPYVDLVNSFDSTDAGVHYETTKLHFFASYNHYEIDTIAKPAPTMLDNIISRTVSNTAKNMNYDVKKAGVKYDETKFWAQIEFIEGHTYAYSNTGKLTYDQKSRDKYYIIGIHLNDSDDIYIGCSNGRSHVSGRDPKFDNKARDHFVGFSKEDGRWAVAVEYHHGYGKSYAKFDDPTSSWNSWVTSFTYRF